ncbi:phosphotransferase [Gluconacetobacter entanii]|uniref:Hydroxylysine kinase n=1 Tax=Gluconacetobacter entanii TaxID=108528 RepID=A0A318Q905_9PROT|nr:phosphotransferase [Gluconacetobacter entanii]MCE2577361.1 phosphotransferase [Komagataeibacter sp. FNDCR1]PYD62347.1 serine kinase [Gluconacetobacter entanii]
MNTHDGLSAIFEQYGNISRPFTHMPPEEALAIAREHYGADGDIRHLPTEKDDTFHIRCASGRGFIMKVEHPCEPREDVAFQTALLDDLKENAPDLPVPRVIRTQHDAPVLVHTDRAGQERQIRLLSYLQGVPLDHIPTSADGRRRIGAQLARLRHALAGFSHPGGDRAIIWDVRRLPDLRALLSLIEDPLHRACAQAAMTRFMDLLPDIGKLRTQILHNDFNRSNILARAHDDETLAGIIDFGDALRTAIAIDVSTAMVNQLPQDVTPDAAAFLSAPRDVLHGYVEHADLQLAEIGMLGHLLMARLLTRALITTWRAGMFSENRAYIMRHSQATWKQLAWFVERDADTISDLFVSDTSFSNRMGCKA